MSFSVEPNLPFAELQTRMYSKLKDHLCGLYPQNIDKVERVLRGVVGF